MVPEESFEKLEQLVFDENKIITSKILSHELQIHINEAKQCMHDFFKIQKKKANSVVHAHYFLAGTVEKEGVKALKVQVAAEDTLEETKKKFTEITSCHIYSLSKRKQVDECSLYNAENMYFKNVDERNKYSAIKHPNIELRPPVLAKMNIIRQEPKLIPLKKQETPASSRNGSSSSTSDQPLKAEVLIQNGKNTVEKKETETAKIENQEEVKKEKNEKLQKQNTLASMWKKSEDKSKSTKNENTKADSKGKNKSPQGASKNVTKNNILSMFSKQADKNALNGIKKSPAVESVTKEDVISRVEKQIFPEKKATPAPSASKASNKKRKSSQKTTKPSAKKQDSDSEEDNKSQKKKRRRICVFEESDSDSESEEAKDRAQRSIWNSEDPLLDESPISKNNTMQESDEEPIPPTPPVVIQKGKKRVLKTVQKTYQDEDGYFVTKQEKKLVSDSDDEDPLPPKSNDTLKPNLLTNRKQASLTSFFKQK